MDVHGVIKFAELTASFLADEGFEKYKNLKVSERLVFKILKRLQLTSKVHHGESLSVNKDVVFKELQDTEIGRASCRERV